MTENFERMLLAALVKDKNFLEETEGYINEEVFSNEYYSYFFKIIDSYYKACRNLISFDIFMHLVKKTAKDIFSQEELAVLDQTAGNIFDVSYEIEFLKKELNDYVRRIKTRNILLKSIDNFDDESIDDIAKNIEQATQQIVDDAPLEYVNSIGNRELRNEPISTMISGLDDALDGGISPGELGIVTAMSSGGKSLLLLNLAYSGVVHDKKVLYITLEDSEDMVLKKFDTIFTGLEFKTVKRHPSKVASMKPRFMRHANKLYVKDYTSGGCSIGKIRALLSKPNMRDTDLLILDYIDELPASNSRGDRWQEVEDSTRELKAMAHDLKIPVWTATQTSSSSYYKENVDLKDTYGGKGKIHVAHIVLVICQTEKELKNGILRIKVAKQKSGPKGAIIECTAKFNKMRIVDAKV